MTAPAKFYITTPIYYVNDRPHIGHVYTTTVADIIARYHRLRGDDVFFLTGTDEHAAKVADAAAERGLSPQELADKNAAVFEQTAVKLRFTNDDFIRTSQERHKSRVTQYVQQMTDSGDVYPGEYEGWYDAGQEEYVPENKAKKFDYKSPVNGKPLVRKKEQNYFFRLSKYRGAVLKHIEQHPEFVQPDARRNEVVARIREGLNDVAISRSGAGGWGIPLPADPTQTIYVWIDALFNYATTVDTNGRQGYWPADVHLIGKEILWFHAVIWPAMLFSLGKPLYHRLYAHSFWISEGQKMSKTLGNFIELEQLDEYAADFGLDAVRYYLATQGPLGASDADFAHGKFVEVYNADLANTLGNCFSRISNMTQRYFDGRLPEHGPHVGASDEYANNAEQTVAAYARAMEQFQLEQAASAALDLVRSVDAYIEKTQPFKLAKDRARLPEVGTILYNCAEAIRIASVLLWPILPTRIEQLWRQIGRTDYAEALADKGGGALDQWSTWGQLQPGTPIQTGEALFPRHQPGK